jgi:DNA-binding CsgD family transcriptional regulator
MDGGFLLLNQSSTHASKCFKLTEGTFVLGRSLSCDFVVWDETVSRQHAKITVADGRVHVCDLGSRNGTFLDDSQVRECILSTGQRLRFGDVIFALANPQFEGQDRFSEEETASCGNAVRDLEFDLGKFSTAECRVLELLLDGLSEKEIAAQLHLSQHTIHNHVRAIYRITDVHTRAELLARFIRKQDD